MPKGNETHGRIPIVLTGDDKSAFNERFAIVFHRARGIALVADDLTDETLTFSQFKRQHGVRGQLWLASDDARGYPSPDAHKAARSQRPAVEPTATPRKEPYRTSSAGQ